MLFTVVAHCDTIGDIVKPHGAVSVTVKAYVILLIGINLSIKTFGNIPFKTEDASLGILFPHRQTPSAASFAAVHFSRNILM